ncbi:MAG: hypothetical protein WC412_08360 [Candidatus Omnitrophota bacterium]|jgi:hypothetical protein
MEDQKIDPTRTYWLHEIATKKLIPEIKSYATLKKFVERKQLRCTIYGTENSRRYMVKGSDLIAFGEKLNGGEFVKPKM